MTPVDISVVICTYNRATLLRTALQSILNLRTDDTFHYEIVVVDNGCTDETESVISTAAEDASVLVCGVREDRRGVAAARNRGIMAARGSWIAFFDDDQVADPDWLIQLFAAASQFETRCVAGAVRLLLPDDALNRLAPICRRLLGELVPVDQPQRLGKSIGAGTGNLLVHKSIFEQIGTFDESLLQAGEDTDILNRMRGSGIEGWFTPLATVGHVVPPHRLTNEYFRWASLRSGTYIARHDWNRWGAFGFPIIFAGRLAQIFLHFIPRWIWGHIRHSKKDIQTGRCLLWRAEGYMRLVLSWVHPSQTAASTLQAQTDFRTERERFAQTMDSD